MADDEADYMSDEFVSRLVSDVRPGLVFSHSHKRQHEVTTKQVEANKRSRTKPVRLLEEEKRSQALGQALTSNNKGFLLLLKMGYRPGTAIGKQDGAITATPQEPIRPVVKNNRLGLGLESEQERVARDRKRILQDRQRQMMKSNHQISLDYQARVRNKRKEKQVTSDLWHSQKVCLELDTHAEVQSACEDWFWPPGMQDSDQGQESDSTEQDTEEDSYNKKANQLEMLTVYLRQTYFYCLWCGVKYNDILDLESSCPGATSEDHE